MVGTRAIVGVDADVDNQQTENLARAIFLLRVGWL